MLTSSVGLGLGSGLGLGLGLGVGLGLFVDPLNAFIETLLRQGRARPDGPDAVQDEPQVKRIYDIAGVQGMMNKVLLVSKYEKRQALKARICKQLVKSSLSLIKSRPISRVNNVDKCKIALKEFLPLLTFDLLACDVKNQRFGRALHHIVHGEDLCWLNVFDSLVNKSAK